MLSATETALSGVYDNKSLRKICSVYVGITVCLLGLIGNMFSIIVWSRINKKRSSAGKSAGVYLIILAIVDSGLLLLFLSTEAIQMLVPSIMDNYTFVAFYSYFGFPMYFYFICASIWMVVCVTFNRFIAVLFPLRVQTINGLTYTYTISASTLIFSFIVNFPHFFNFYPIDRNGHGVLGTTSYGKSQGAKSYNFWVHCMFIVLMPWISIFSFNCAIIFRLFSNSDIQSNKPKGSKRERQTTIILLTISVSFLVFLIWQCLTQCFWMLGYGKEDKLIWFDVDSSYDFARLGVVINSSVNFLLYCIAGSMFRLEMAKLFKCCCGVGYEKFEESTSRSNPRSVSAVSADEDVSDMNDITKDTSDNVQT